MMRLKKKKNYDIYISPGQRPIYKGQRILFVSSVLTFVLNMSLIAAFSESMRKAAIIAILLSAVLAIVHFFDNRKVHWSWLYNVGLCAMLHFFSAASVFYSKSLFMIVLWAGELVFFSVIIGLSLYKKNNR